MFVGRTEDPGLSSWGGVYREEGWEHRRGVPRSHRVVRGLSGGGSGLGEQEASNVHLDLFAVELYSYIYLMSWL